MKQANQNGPATGVETNTGGAVLVVGLTREAAIARPLGRVVIGAAGLARLSAPPLALISFGLCGALADHLRPGDLVIPDRVIATGAVTQTDAGLTAQLRRILAVGASGDLAAGDKIHATAADKRALRQATGAHAVDMESHHVAAAAREWNRPFAVLRVVSDAAARSLPRAAQAGFRADGRPDIAAVLLALAQRPWELPSLIRTGLEAETAFRALAAAAGRLPAQGSGWPP